MRLTQHSDFALRALLYLACHPDRMVSTEEISRAYGISQNHLVKVVNRLGKAGVLEIRRGRRGGLRLRRPPAEIRLGDVVRTTEPDFRIVECFDPATDGCPISGVCRLRGPLHEAAEAFIAALNRHTLSDVAGPAMRPEYARHWLQAMPAPPA